MVKQTNMSNNKQTNKECLEYVVTTNFSTVKKDLGKKKREEYLACPDNFVKNFLKSDQQQRGNLA